MKLQFDDLLPVTLEKNKQYKIPKETYHRILKGKGNLILEIREEGGMVTFLMETIDDGGELKLLWRLEGSQQGFQGHRLIEGKGVIAVAEAKDQGRPLISPDGFEGEAVDPQP